MELERLAEMLSPVTPGGLENGHFYFRAVDIDAVGGEPVVRRPIPDPVIELGRTLLTLPAEVRPDSVLGPSKWHAALGGGSGTGFRDHPEVNARHHDHLHLGYRR